MKDDVISRQAAIDAVCAIVKECFWADEEELDAIETTIMELLSVQPEITEEDIREWCYKRCLTIIDNALYLEMRSRWSASAQPEIIHCRDCKYWQSEEHIGNNNVHTLVIASLPCKNWLTGGDWYCGSAERRTDERQT